MSWIKDLLTRVNRPAPPVPVPLPNVEPRINLKNFDTSAFDAANFDTSAFDRHRDAQLTAWRDVPLPGLTPTAALFKGQPVLPEAFPIAIQQYHIARPEEMASDLTIRTGTDEILAVRQLIAGHPRHHYFILRLEKRLYAATIESIDWKTWETDENTNPAEHSLTIRLAEQFGVGFEGSAVRPHLLYNPKLRFTVQAERPAPAPADDPLTEDVDLKGEFDQ